MDMNSKSKNGSIVLLIVLLICSGLGISAFVMVLTKCKPCKVEEYQSTMRTARRGADEEEDDAGKFAKSFGGKAADSWKAAGKPWESFDYDTSAVYDKAHRLVRKGDKWVGVGANKVGNSTVAGAKAAAKGW